MGKLLARRLANENVRVIAVGRREGALKETARGSEGRIIPCVCDIARASAHKTILEKLPGDAKLAFLVHNAAIGDPAVAPGIDMDHFRYAMDVNVIAPLALSQALFSRLKNANGRILHLGTGVARTVQRGTGTYGITKLAFYRMYKQLAEDFRGTGVLVGSARPGVVKTEGMLAHVDLAKDLNLPHAKYFTDLFQGKGDGLQEMSNVTDFLYALLTECPDDEYGAKEWGIRETTEWWRGSDNAQLPDSQL